MRSGLPFGENGQVSLSEHDLFGWLGWHVEEGGELLIEAALWERNQQINVSL